MFKATDTPWAPWFVVNSDDKRRARLNLISHLLRQIPYEKLPSKRVKLPKRQGPHGYREPDYQVRHGTDLAVLSIQLSSARLATLAR